MDKKLVEQCKQKLEQQRAALEKEINELKRQLSGERENFAEEEERAQADVERLEKEARLESLTREKNHVEHTLKKVSDGKFGVCEKCGGEIDTERLTLLPTACLCMKCKMVCDNCGVAIEEHLMTGKSLPANCQNCEEEFEPEITYTTQSLNPKH